MEKQNRTMNEKLTTEYMIGNEIVHLELQTKEINIYMDNTHEWAWIVKGCDVIAKIELEPSFAEGGGGTLKARNVGE